MGPAFVFLHRKRLLPSLSASPAQCLLSLGHSSNSGQTKTSWGGEISDNHLVQGQNCMVDAWKFPTWTVCAHTLFLVVHISPAFIDQLTPFPNIPFVHCTFTAHFNNLTVNFCQMNVLVCKNHISDPTLWVVGVSVFMLIFNDYSEWEEKL
jgi:hypothetical protein